MVVVLMADFYSSLITILNYEGGYSNDPRDNGGKTNYGITEAEARRHGYTGDMLNIPMSIVEEIYKKNYWDILNLDYIINDEIALKIFNIGVNCGTVTAGIILQRSLNLLDDFNLKVDGLVGSDTINALCSLSESDLKYLHLLISILHGNRYINITETNKVNRAFIRGWLNRVRFNDII